MDINTFANSCGINLNGSQSTILKLYYGEDLDEEKTFTIRNLNLDKDSFSWEFEDHTESSYAQKLSAEGRLHVGSNTKGLIWVAGRRSGKTVIATLMCLYEAFRCLELEGPTGRVENISVISYTREAANRVMFGVHEMYAQTPHIPKARWSARDALTWKRNPDLDYGDLKLGVKTALATAVRGMNSRFFVLDEYDHFASSGEDLWNALYPSVVSWPESHFAVVSSPILGRGFLLQRWEEGLRSHRLDRESPHEYQTPMLVRTPTWENPDFLIQDGEISKQIEQHLPVFLAEFGAEFMEERKVYVPVHPSRHEGLYSVR